VIIAKNGREAIKILESSKKEFDLVILDMNMPRMSGDITFKIIKERYPQLKVVVCSGYAAASLDHDKFMELIDGFIQKPFEIDDYAQTVRRVLDMKKDT